jgi:hypothetical protein
MKSFPQPVPTITDLSFFLFRNLRPVKLSGRKHKGCELPELLGNRSRAQFFPLGGIDGLPSFPKSFGLSFGNEFFQCLSPISLRAIESLLNRGEESN